MSIFKKIILRQKANIDASKIVGKFKNNEDNNVIQVHDKQGKTWYVKDGAAIKDGRLVSTQDIPEVDGKEQFSALVGLADADGEVRVLPFKDLQLDDVQTSDQARAVLSDYFYSKLKTQQEGDRHIKHYLSNFLFHIKKLFDTLLILGAIIILFIALLSTQPYNYYVFLRWYIFLYSIYLIYKAKSIVILGTKLGGILFCAAIAIIFNPFIPFAFLKTTWRIFDLALIVINLLFLYLRIEDYYKDSLSKRGQIIFNLIGHCLLVCVVMFIMVWFVFYTLGNPYHEYLLITKGETAKGFIISSEEHEGYVERYGIDYQSFNVYFVYTFTTKTGKTIKDQASVSSPVSGYLSEANVKSIPIEVEYIPNKPKINRVKGMTTQPTTLKGFVWRIVFGESFLLLLFCFVGYKGISASIKEGIRELNSINHRYYFKLDK